MSQRYGKSERVDRLIQYAIDIFDLVEIVPAAHVEQSISRQFFGSDASVATPYTEAESKILQDKRAFVLDGGRVC